RFPAGAYHNVPQDTAVCFFIVCRDAEFVGYTAHRFDYKIIAVILDNTCIHIGNYIVSARAVKPSNALTVFFPDRNTNFVAIAPWIFHTDWRMSRDIVEVGDFSQDVFYLVVFHFQLHMIAHMLNLAAAAFIKHITRGIYPVGTSLFDLEQLTKTKFFVHLDNFDGCFLPGKGVWNK